MADPVEHAIAEADVPLLLAHLENQGGEAWSREGALVVTWPSSLTHRFYYTQCAVE